MEFLYPLILGFLLITPLDVLVNWLYARARHIRSRLDEPKARISFSRFPLIFALSKLINTAKGAGVPLLADYAYESTFVTAILTVAMLILHNWSPFLGLKNRQNGLYLLWGVYIYMAPALFWAFPVAGILFSLLFNSPYIGGLLAVLGFVFAAALNGQAEPIDLILSFSIFVVVFLIILEPLFQHLEKRNGTLLALFKTRSRLIG